MKLTRKGCAFTALAGILVLSGCANETPWSPGSDQDGKITLKLATDGSVNKSTRADDGVSPVIPALDAFSIALESRDGSYSKTWGSPDSFNKEDGFPMGSYTLTAIAGDIEEEGFSNPCFKGSTEVAVRLGEETSSTVTASLANCMVSVRYSDEFIALFPNYQALLTSDGHVSPVIMTMGETRPVYMSPRNIKLSLSLTNQQGKTQTFQSTTFTAEERHHYIINVGITEKVGVNVLDIAFEENVVSETMEVLLSDEAFNAVPPTVTSNPDAESVIEAIEYCGLSGKNPEIHVVAMSGITGASLMFETVGGTLPLTNSTIDLVKMTPADDAVLKNAGIVCSGFSSSKVDSEGNPVVNKMAVVNFADFTKSLVPGNYKAKLVVVDKFQKEAESSYIEFNVAPLTYTLSKTVEPKYLADHVELGVTSNSNAINSDMTFKIDGQEAKVLSMTNPVASDNGYDYKVTLQYPSKNIITDSQCVVEGVVGKKPAASLTLATEMPAYTVDVDAWTKTIMLRINNEDAAIREAIVSNCKVYNDNSPLPENFVTRYPEEGYIEVSGRSAATAYPNLSLVLGSSKERNSLPLGSVQTEAAAGVPNGDFEDLTETINSTIQQGGKWTITSQPWPKPTEYSTTLSIVVKEPNGWLSTNSITFNKEASNKNSWYVVPSVYNTSLSWLAHQPNAKVGVIGQSAYDSTADVYKKYQPSSGNAMVIRNVAWDNNGPDIGLNTQTGNTDNFSNYFCKNHPSSIANRSAGRMWLGIAGQEGAAFASRPTKLKGFYQFVADSQDPNERGVVEIQLLSGDKVIGSAKAELTSCSKYTEFSLPISYLGKIAGFGLKATSLRISFSSSNHTSDSDIKTTNYCNKDECVSRGAMLVVDNLSFKY